MDNIKIKIVANPLYGTTGSLVTLPFMGQVVHTKTVNAADIQKLIDAEHPQMTDPLAELTANQLLTYGADKIADEEKRFNFGSDYFAFEPAISGSVATADAKLGEDNTPYINVVNGTALGNRLAAIIPSIVKEDLGDVMFHSVESVKDGESVKNAIYGGGDFTFIGKRLSFAASDEKLELRHPTTGAVVSAVTVKSGDTLGQRITAALATPPAADGTYKLYAQSHGKDTPDANIKSGFVTVDYIAPVLPKVNITSASAVVSEMANSVGLEIENFRAVKGYSEDDTNFYIPAKATYKGETIDIELFNAKTEETTVYAEMINPEFAEELAAGETVSFEIELDPAKASSYAAGVMTKSCVVTE